MPEPTIAFIGAGNMGQALIHGLIQSGYKAEYIIAADPVEEHRSKLEQDYQIRTSTENKHACLAANVVVLAVKPQQVQAVLSDLTTSLAERKPLLMSIAAGISTESIYRLLQNPAIGVVRCMPNTPALVQSGASALFASSNTDHTQRVMAESIMRSVGTCIWLENESLMDVATAVSGSGPAYFFLLMEALIDAGVKLGLDREQAYQLCLQTAYGSAKLAINEGIEASELRRRVTSPGGTTEAAIAVLQTHHFQAILEQAVVAAEKRSQELSQMFGEQQ